MRHALTPHPHSPCEAVTSLEVEVSVAGSDLTLRYLLTGDLDRIVMPKATASVRVDGLWEHTCFEAFVGGDGEAYGEFNFAPSTAWAAYHFDGYRRGMAQLDTDAPRIATKRGGGKIEVLVTIARPAGSRLGLTAVIEAAGGRLSYWALAHPTAEPDFHHAGGRVLPL